MTVSQVTLLYIKLKWREVKAGENLFNLPKTHLTGYDLLQEKIHLNFSSQQFTFYTL